MTVSLILMALWTSALLSVGAWAVDRLLRPVRVQTRLVWAIAMAMSVAVVGTAPLRLWWTARASRPSWSSWRATIVTGGW